MKKFGFSVLIAGLVLMLSGCYFLVPLSAEVTVENKSDKAVYCLAKYNKVSSSEGDIFLLNPGEKTTKTLKGTLTKAMYSDSTEHFDFYWREKANWEAEKAKNHVVNDVAFNFTWENDNYATANNKRSQNYKVVITNGSASGNLAVELSW